MSFLKNNVNLFFLDVNTEIYIFEIIHKYIRQKSYRPSPPTTPLFTCGCDFWIRLQKCHEHDANKAKMA